MSTLVIPRGGSAIAAVLILTSLAAAPLSAEPRDRPLARVYTAENLQLSCEPLEDFAEAAFREETMAFVGGNNTPLVKKWQGGVWSNLGSLPAGGVGSISGTSDRDLWVGARHGSALPYQLYHWDGHAWALQTLPNQHVGVEQMVVVHAFSENSVIAYGTGNDVGAARVWYYDGTGWVHLFSPWWAGNTHGAMLALAPNEIYFAGNGWWDRPGLYLWNGATLVQESATNLPPSHPSPPHIYLYCGLGWDGTNLWILDAGGSGGEAARLRRGNFGSPWTLEQTFGPVDGYAYSYVTATQKAMVMDENGILSISAQAYLGPNDVILQGDPRFPMNEIVPGTGGTNPWVGEKAALGGYYLMTNNYRGSWYDPAVGTWTTPADGGWGSSCGAHIVRVTIPVGASEEDRRTSGRFELRPNTPNPFRSTTTLRFEIPEPADVVLAVYDVRGRRVATLEEGHRPAGLFASCWNGRNDAGQLVSPGIYFARLRVGEGTLVRKMVHLR